VLPLLTAALIALLPGVRTPSHNISCFVVPIKPTSHANLLCDIHRASYTGALQHRCIDGPAGLDWHGFSIAWNGRAQVVCSGGILYDSGHDRPSYTVLGYGRTWRSSGFTCTSRVAGLTCRNRGGHGLFLSRLAYRLF
jgi:hypothetical protein